MISILTNHTFVYNADRLDRYTANKFVNHAVVNIGDKLDIVD